MTFANVTLQGKNSVEHSFKIERQGDRKVDSAEIDFAHFEDARYGAEVQILKDEINGMDMMSFYHAFHRNMLDESGHNRHLTDLSIIPNPNLYYSFDDTLVNYGTDRDRDLASASVEYVEGFKGRAVRSECGGAFGFPLAHYNSFSLSFAFLKGVRTDSQQLLAFDTGFEIKQVNSDIVVEFGGVECYRISNVPDGWHMFGLTYDAGGSSEGIRGYLDGRYVVSNIAEIDFTYEYSELFFEVGNTEIAMDEVKVWFNRVLTDQQILYEYQGALVKYEKNGNRTKLTRYGNLEYEFEANREINNGNVLLALDYNSNSTDNIVRLTDTNGVNVDITGVLLERMLSDRILLYETFDDDITPIVNSLTPFDNLAHSTENGGSLFATVRGSNFQYGISYEFTATKDISQLMIEWDYRLKASILTRFGLYWIFSVNGNLGGGENVSPQSTTTLDTGWDSYNASQPANVSEGDVVKVEIGFHNYTPSTIRDFEMFIDNFKLFSNNDRTPDQGFHIVNMMINNGMLNVNLGSGDSYPYELANIKKITYGHGNVQDGTNGLYWCRSYNGFTVEMADITTLNADKDFRTVMFGGRIREVEDGIVSRKATCRSYGELLNTTDVGYEQLYSTGVKELLRLLILRNTNMVFIDEFDGDDIELASYTFRGKIITNLQKLITYLGAAWYVDRAGLFHLVGSLGNETDRVFVHGEDGVSIERYDNDDTIMKNDISVIGQGVSNEVVESYSGRDRGTSRADSSGLVLRTRFYPENVSIRQANVFQGGGNTVDFTDFVVERPNTIRLGESASALFSGERNYGIYYTVTYTHTVSPVYKQRDEDSISRYGIVRSERKREKGITNYEDGVIYSFNRLNELSTVRDGLHVVLPTLDLDVDIDDVIECRSSYREEHNGLYRIRSIDWMYPEFQTLLKLGDHQHDNLEKSKTLTEKIHDLEDSDEVLNLEETQQVQVKLGMRVEAAVLQIPRSIHARLGMNVRAVARDLTLRPYGVAVYNGYDIYG